MMRALLILPALVMATGAAAQARTSIPDPGDKAAYMVCAIRTATELAPFDRTAESIAETTVRSCEWRLDAHLELRSAEFRQDPDMMLNRDMVLRAMHGVAVAAVNRLRRQS